MPSEQIDDWWTPRLQEDQAWVSSDDTGLSGLIALRPDGYLDLFFVSPRARADGTAKRLYAELIAAALASGLNALTCHASDYLKPFLEARGWQIEQEEQVERFGVTLRRWAMSLDQVADSQRS